MLEAATHVRLARALRPRPAPPRLAAYPSLTMIRPIKALDVELEENVRAALDHGYPGAVETLFVFDAPDEPGVPVVERVLAGRGPAASAARVLFCGAPPPGRTGKLHAMLHGLRHARGELVAFADSDIRTDRDALRVLVETLEQAPRAGAAFAPVAVSEPARSFGDAFCALLLNGLYTPPAAVYARRHDGELPFILGQLMVLNRKALDAMDGLERVQGQLVDDLYMGQLVRRAGLRNVMSSHPIRIVQHGLDWHTALAVSQRWFAFSRTGIPEWSFKAPIAQRAATSWLGVLGAVAFALAGALAPAVAAAGLAAGVTWSVGRMHEHAGGARLRGLHRLAPLAVYAIAPFLLLRAIRARRVRWRGRDYALDAGGRLAAPTSADAGAAARELRPPAESDPRARTS